MEGGPHLKKELLFIRTAFQRGGGMTSISYGCELANIVAIPLQRFNAILEFDEWGERVVA